MSHFVSILNALTCIKLCAVAFDDATTLGGHVLGAFGNLARVDIAVLVDRVDVGLEACSVGVDRLEAPAALSAVSTLGAVGTAGSTGVTATTVGAARAARAVTAASAIRLLDGRAGAVTAAGTAIAADRTGLVGVRGVLLGLVGARASDTAEVRLLLLLGIEGTRGHSTPGALHH